MTERLGHWQLGTLLTYHTGFPYTPADVDASGMAMPADGMMIVPVWTAGEYYGQGHTAPAVASFRPRCHSANSLTGVGQDRPNVIGNAYVRNMSSLGCEEGTLAPRAGDRMARSPH